MKKITLLVFFAFFCFLSNAQVQIGSGNDEEQSVPFEPYFEYSYGQSIYLSSEINTSGSITGIRWYFSGSSTLTNSQNLVIYLGHTSKPEFEDSADWEPVENLTQVYSGGITVTQQGWVTINFSTPFVYNGTDNLVVAVEENKVDYDSYNDDFYNSAVTGNRSISAYSDDINIDPLNPNVEFDPDFEYIGRDVYSYVPNIIFLGIQQACSTPLLLTVSNITSNSASFAWESTTPPPSGGFQYFIGTDNTNPGDQFTGSTTNLNFNYTSFDPDTENFVWVRAICDGGVKSAWALLTFDTYPELGPGNLCYNPIIIDLPYTTTDDTADYGSDFYEGSPGGENGCGSPNSYLSGNDVIYSYTATTDGAIKIVLTPATAADTYMGVFVYGSCSAIGNSCLAGAVTGNSSAAVSIPEFSVTTGQTYYFVVSTWAAPETAAYSLDITQNTCINHTINYDIVSNCQDGEEGFNVKVNVTSLGSATSVSITDDQGSAVQQANAIGTYTFGPYANDTDVVFTIENNQDASCVVTSPVLNQVTCPPVNDDPVGAREIVLDLGATCGANKITNISNLSTSGSAEVAPSCSDQYNPSQGNGDLWFKFTALAPTVTLEISDIAGEIFSVSSVLYSGTSGDFVEVGDCNNSSIKVYTGLTVGTTYYFRVWDYGNDDIGTWSICGYYLDCEMPEVEYDVVSNCENGNEQFFISVNVTDMGSATSLLITDDEGSASQQANAIGTYTFGPYENDTEVVITVENEQNASCKVISDDLNQVACPPINDECINAISLTVDAAFCDGVNNNGTNLGATDSGITMADCFNYGENDVWFSFVVPEGVASVDISTDFTGGTLVDTEIALYSGACGALVELDCDQDSGDTILSNDSSYNSFIEDTPVSVNQTYYVRVSGYSESSIGSFCLEVSTNEVLSTPDFGSNKIGVYPNPVKDILYLSYDQTISEVHVYSIIGQSVISSSANSKNASVDMKSLSAGTYIVKVVTENLIKTLKVIKQ